jgi:hypothetical protein
MSNVIPFPDRKAKKDPDCMFFDYEGNPFPEFTYGDMADFSATFSFSTDLGDYTVEVDNPFANLGFNMDMEMVLTQIQEQVSRNPDQQEFVIQQLKRIRDNLAGTKKS